MASYPKWLYSHGKLPRVVADEAEHQALGPGWVESPADAQSDSVADVREMREGEDESARPAPKPTRKSKA